MSAQEDLVRWVRETPGASEMLMEDVMPYDPDPLDGTADVQTEWLWGYDTHEPRPLTLKVVLLALGVGAALGFVAGWVAR